MIVRAQDLRKMSESEIDKKLEDVQAEMIRQRGKITTGGAPENPGRMKLLRRTIARIITIKKERAKESVKSAKKKQ